MIPAANHGPSSARRRRSAGLHLLALLSGVLLTDLALRHLRAPYPWIFFGWSLPAAAAMLAWRRTAPRLLAVNVFWLALVLGGLELWLTPADREEQTAAPPRLEGSYTQGYFRRGDPVLGYGAWPDRRFTSRKFTGERQVYAVTYTIGKDGLRVSPRHPQKPPALFFGGSFTFGEGVDDRESMPYQAALQAGGNIDSYNFGFHGYGPHQMLAALEFGRVADLVPRTARWAVYQALPHHAARAAGEAAWDVQGPCYQLNGSGEAVHRGRFFEVAASQPETGPWRKALARSAIGRRFLDLTHRRTRKNQAARMAAIVDRARSIFEAGRPDAEFHVIFWNDAGRMSDRIEADLRSRGIRLHRITDILPGIHTRPEDWLITDDGHPNARAHRRIAAYVVNRIFDLPVPSGESAPP